MARTILVTVGISLVTDKVNEKESVAAGFGDLGSPFATLGALGEALAEADRQEQAGRRFNGEHPRWVNGRSALVRQLGALWKNQNLPSAAKRAWSGAELASLSLLGENERGRKPLVSDDRVILLASDTPSGKFCAETIAEAVREGVIGVTLKDVRVMNVVGLRADDADSFLNAGLPNTALQLAAQRSDDTLLIASGGYKGLLPYLTPIAMRLEIPLLYLYEESDRMLEIGSLEFPADLKLVYEFRKAFNRIDPTQGRTEECAKVFWADVDAKDPHNGRARLRDLVTDSGEVVKLTATGVLACTLQLLTLPNG
ncbi:MAG: hypothetical protein KF893_26215 [Caldilineaceae bacterium]|nr:hypothetical protein [Caldilineaceae bacterium]